MGNTSLGRVVKKELKERYHWQRLEMSKHSIPQGAFFQHVVPFIAPVPRLSQEDIVEILKADEEFYRPGVTAESEVEIFAELLRKLIDKPDLDAYYVSSGKIGGWFDHSAEFGLSLELSLCFKLPNAGSLQDILEGKFSVVRSWQKECMDPKCAVLVSGVAGALIYGAIQGFNFAEDGNNYHNDFLRVFVGLLSVIAGGLALALVSLFISTVLKSLLCIPCVVEKSCKGIDLVSFAEKYGQPPQVLAGDPGVLTEDVLLLPATLRS